MWSTRIEEFLKFLREVEQGYHMAEADELEANNETQDILHSLELEEHDYRGYAKISKELKEVRKRRRVAKDVLLSTESILIWMDENRNFIKGLEKLLGDVRKAERKTENRIYTPRVAK